MNLFHRFTVETLNVVAANSGWRFRLPTKGSERPKARAKEAGPRPEPNGSGPTGRPKRARAKQAGSKRARAKWVGPNGPGKWALARTSEMGQELQMRFACVYHQIRPTMNTASSSKTLGHEAKNIGFP